ncbi:MAG: DNA sulfur modification protein DndB [Cyanobacteriota bacterium]|jgi:DNA sulfur modification protein DndB
MFNYFPSLQAKMGDWHYYVTVMKWGEVCGFCLAEEIHSNKDLDALIQRAIQDHVHKEMVPYLLNESQRFYGALVVAVYGGDPEFSPVKVAEHELIDDKENYTYGFGLLRFDGSQIYYALDGQHRLKSIQEAIKGNPDLAQEEISVIILKHEQTKEGLQRTRRLFSTLNRRAKPTSSGINIAIDEDDCIAIVSRRLVKENETLKNLVSTTLSSKTLSPTKSQDPYITTLAAFYDTNEILLSGFEGGLDVGPRFKQFRPSYEDIDKYYLYLENIWMLMINKCPRFELVINGSRKPGDLRKRQDHNGIFVLNDAGEMIPGGSIFARPNGQYVVAEVIKQASVQGKPVEDTIDAIMSNISMDIDDAPWAGVVWNPITKTILGNKSQRSLLVAIISHALGLKIKTKIRELKQKYRETIADPKAQLLPAINWSGNTNFGVVSETDPDDDSDFDDYAQ